MHSRHILSTGLHRCYNDDGAPIDCRGTGQDAEFCPGVAWPVNRFELINDYLVRDRATQLCFCWALKRAASKLSWSLTQDTTAAGISSLLRGGKPRKTKDFKTTENPRIFTSFRH